MNAPPGDPPNPRPPKPPPGPPPRPPPPPPPGPLTAPCPAPTSFPKPKVLLSRKFKVNNVVPVPTLIGIVGPLGVDAALNVPHCVTRILLGGVDAVTGPGLSLKMESPFTSCPTVTLNGTPELTMIKGFRRNA